MKNIRYIKLYEFRKNKNSTKATQNVYGIYSLNEITYQRNRKAITSAEKIHNN